MDQHLVYKCCHPAGNYNNDQDRARHCILPTAQITRHPGTGHSRISGSLLAAIHNNADSYHRQHSGYHSNDNGCGHQVSFPGMPK
jgi:hypothetical protein